MKNLVTLSILLLCVAGFSQEQSISIDYTVDYLIPNRRQQAMDTVSVGYQKDGKYIWTNSNALAQDLGKSIFRRNPELLENADLAIIYDTENALLMMCFLSGENEIFFKFEISNFLPPIPQDGDMDSYELISENTGEVIEVLDYKSTVYDIFPSNKETDIMTVAFNNDLKVKNKQLFKKIFQMILSSQMGSEVVDVDIPEGLIMKVTNKGKTMLEAYHVETSTKTININYSFKITE
ncbi:hypothetical protein ACU8DI_14445 [Psychroserpens sp. BH13MA-6]